MFLKKLQNISERINALQMRERALVALSAMAFIYMLWDFSFFQSKVQQESVLSERLSVAKTELTKLTAEEKILAKALTNDPTAAKRREIVRLEKQLAKLESDLRKISVGLIAAEQLPEILYDVLRSSSGVEFVAMTTHPAKPLPFPMLSIKSKQDKVDTVDNEEDDFDNDVSVYQHAVTVEIEGSYFDVVGYLSRLEALQWRFYWELLDYEVSTYPRAKIILQVYTLSTEEGLLRV